MSAVSSKNSVFYVTGKDIQFVQERKFQGFQVQKTFKIQIPVPGEPRRLTREISKEIQSGRLIPLVTGAVIVKKLLADPKVVQSIVAICGKYAPYWSGAAITGITALSVLAQVGLNAMIMMKRPIEPVLRDYTVQQICENPKMLIIPHFLSNKECEYLIEYATPSLKSSTKVFEDIGQTVPTDFRTSNQMYCPQDHEDPLIKGIENRIAETTKTPHSHGEPMQIVHYEKGGQFGLHWDVGGEEITREITFLMYLNTPTKGGETVFPRVNISVTPTKGTAFVFWNLLQNRDANPKTLHAGAPVLEGEKWIATRWIHNFGEGSTE
jgi:prolyl 4-hydroxylase